MTNSETTRIPGRIAASLLLCLLSALAGSARAGDGGGASAGVDVTAKIMTCLPVITATKYEVTVHPGDGLNEGSESSGTTYFPATVATIDNTKCDDAVDVSGATDYLSFSPGVKLEDINASISINASSGKSGGWTQVPHGTDGSQMVLTIPAKSTQTLYAGINPLTKNTAYTEGTAEGSITLTLSPH
ncbi:hypothetical protein V5K00_RS23255 [Enterobacter asburiae]